MQFTRQHQKNFELLSFDKSPIHWDQDYAHRTPMANIVVYGIAGVIYGLGLWADGRPFSIKKIRGQFRRALYLDDEYDYQIKEVDSKVTIKLERKGSVLMEYSFEWEPWDPEGKELAAAETQFTALRCANEDTDVPADRNNVDYAINDQALSEFYRLYLLDPGQFPFEQLLSLLWSSYQVGMVWPGAQALYTSLEFRFSDAGNNNTLNLEHIRHKFDDRFNMATIIAGNETARLTMTAFFRPRPVEYSMEAITAEIETDDSLAGKNVLVLGASRGFGSVLARAFVLKGARVAFNYRTEGSEIDNLKSELSGKSDSVWFFKGDISRQSDCNALHDFVSEALEGLDYLVCNASPQIMAYPFEELDTEEFTHFVDQSISVCHRPLSALLPQLNDGATVINISSIYASQPPKHFSHYVAAKWSLEGMTHALASEYPGLNFIVARLPRMLTDQTNSNFDFEPKDSAITVASGLLERLEHANGDGPYVIDFSSGH